MTDQSYVFGVDFGTDSVRTMLADAANGRTVSQSVHYYSRWAKGLYCDPPRNSFRQHPLDYIEGLEFTISDCLKKAGNDASAKVRAISVDTTGSTPAAVTRDGTPLALTGGFEENPDAMFVLWKDHTAIQEAEEINELAKKFDVNYLQFVGGRYSSEWYWAKLLHVLRISPAVRDAVYSFVEHCDWIPYLLCGIEDANKISRSVCAAGHKALWSEKWGGLPPAEFFASLDPMLKDIAERPFGIVNSSDKAAGTISAQWAERLGLSPDVKIGVGAFDAHMGAVGGQIQPYYLSKVMGTSTCDILVAPQNEIDDTVVDGICGQVNGSVIPGMLGMEAGQSAFGDVFAWFKNLLIWPLKYLDGHSDISASAKQDILEELDANLLKWLSDEAARIPLSPEDELSNDWLNGRRTPDGNQSLQAAITMLDLGSTPPAIFKSLVESTCFGAKAIVERFIEQGVPVNGIIGIGGVAQKSPYVIQVMADVLDMPIKVHKSEQTCAAGAAMFAATVAGIYTSVDDAMTGMGQGFDRTYSPNSEHAAIYRERYLKYKKLGAFLENELTRR